MARSSMSSDAQQRFAIAFMHMLSIVAIAVSLFATGRSKTGFALAESGAARIGPIWTYGCAAKGECWGTTDQASFFHTVLLVTHSVALALVALAFYHSLITRRPLKYSAKGRWLSFFAVGASLAMACGILLLLNATGYSRLEPGIVCPGLATVAEISVFGTMLTLWLAAPPESAETRHGTVKLTRAEEARRYGNGFWLSQHRHLPDSEKQAPVKENLSRYEQPEPEDSIDAGAVYGANNDRLTIGQIVNAKGRKETLPELSQTIRAVAPTVATTRLITPEELFGGQTMIFGPRLPTRGESRRSSLPQGVGSVEDSRGPVRTEIEGERPRSGGRASRSSTGYQRTAKQLEALKQRLPPRPAWLAAKKEASPVTCPPASPSLLERQPDWLNSRSKESPAKKPIILSNLRSAAPVHVAPALRMPRRPESVVLPSKRGALSEQPRHTMETSVQQTKKEEEKKLSQKQADTSNKLGEQMKVNARAIASALGVFGRRIVDATKKPLQPGRSSCLAPKPPGRKGGASPHLNASRPADSPFKQLFSRDQGRSPLSRFMLRISKRGESPKDIEIGDKRCSRQSGPRRAVLPRSASMSPRRDPTHFAPPARQRSEAAVSNLK